MGCCAGKEGGGKDGAFTNKAAQPAARARLPLGVLEQRKAAAQQQRVNHYVIVKEIGFDFGVLCRGGRATLISRAGCW
mgnify:CR=1 FL=1